PVLTLPPVGARDPLLELPTIEVAAEAVAGAEPEAQVGAAPLAEADAQAPAEPELRPEAVQADSRPAWHADSPSDSLPDPLLEPLPAPVVGSFAALAEPLVEWPEDGARRILALRLVAAVDRFPGHIVRQALTAEGFVLGKLSIFHRAAPDGRAVVSAASLNPPGSFDPESIDRQRIGGLSLFAVLPGPLPAARALDELLASARNLNDRLQGQLQDERGAPLTPLRAAEMREGLGTPSTHEG
ncbi:MAG: cell division protein ZipA C-terminal FtsZ-binding domain-containing protein, partial [Steroidobacteraceae bacterium]